MKKYIAIIVAILSCVTGFAQGGYNPENPGDPNPYRKLSITASPKSGGSVGSDNASQIGVGQTVSCYANAKSYYQFVHWLKNGEIVSTNTDFTFVMPDEDVEMIAVFERNYNPQSPDDPQEVKPSHRVTLTASPGKGGRFNNSVFRLCEGDSTNVYAYPSEGYRFEEWQMNGVLVSTRNPLKVKMTDKDLNYTAVFSYNPVNPSDPSANLFNPGTGEMVIDRFEPGRLTSAIYNLLGDDYDHSQIQSLTVSGIMDGSDFGFAYELSNCSKIDLSRTNGYTEIPSYAFESANTLTDLLLPSCISNIGRNAFEGCDNLSEITCYAVVPPVLSYDALTGIDKSVVIKVPAQSIDLYKNAQGWKDFTILPADENVYTLTVALPNDASNGRYKNMSIELLNTTNGQRYKYLITDKTEYVFNNLLSSTTYSVSVKNPKNEALGEISDIEIVDKNLSISFKNLRQPKNITLGVTNPEGLDITADVVVKWFDNDDNLLQQGSTLSGVLENSTVAYLVVLPSQMQTEYEIPTKQTFTVSAQNNPSYKLTKLGKSVLKGKISDEQGQPIRSAVLAISQGLNGTYSNSSNIQCDSEGYYETELPNVPLKVTISANGYVSQNIELSTASEGIGDIHMSKITGMTIVPSYTFQESVVSGSETSISEWYADNANIAYRVEDMDDNEISGCTYQAGSIVLPISVEPDTPLYVIAYSKNNRFGEAKQPVTVNSKTTYVKIPIVEYGGINIKTGDDTASNICMLYDGNGVQVDKASLRGDSISFKNLPDGQYTVVSMRKSSLLGSVLNLSALQQTQLEQGKDYLLNNVNVTSGKITNLSIAAIPELDESKLYFTNSKETYFMPNKSQVTIGNYITLKSKIAMKDEFAESIDAATLIVDIPSNCEFVDNSVISGSGYLGYTFENNRLSVPIQKLSDVVRFCIVPVEGGECKPSAFVKLLVDNNEVLQPIGSAYFEAENFSLFAPQKTSKTTIAVRGTATADSEVAIYDNGILVGKTYSMPNGLWVANIAFHKPYSKSIHDLYAEVVTQDGKRLLTQSRTIDYDQSYVDLSKVTMAYNNTNIIFDHINGKNTATSYSYVPNVTDFTFIADFTENNPEKVSNVVIKVLASDGSVRNLPAEYNATTGNWVVKTKYADSNKLPINISAGYQLNTLSSMFDIERYNDDMHNFNECLEASITSLRNGVSEIISDTSTKREIAIIPEGESIPEYITIEKLDYKQLKAEFEHSPKVIFEDENKNICYRDTIIHNVYAFYYLDNNNSEAYSLTYYGNKKITLDKQHRILPIIISASWGVVSAGVERWLHQGQIDFWRRSFECDKDRIQKNHVALVNALYAECEDGSLKIKDAFNFQIDEEFVDNWADNSVKFLAAYKYRIDLLEQYYSNKFCAQSLFGVGTSFLLGGLGKFIPEVSPLVNNGATAILETFGQALGISVDQFFTGNLKLEDALSRWFETESRKLTDQYVEIFGYIKTDYSDCKEEDDEEDDEDEDNFPTPPITPSIDPSGYVYEAVPSNRIQGVTATAYFKQQTEDMFGDIAEEAVVWDAAPFGQENPLKTDEKGMYAWDVPAGMWQVRFEKEGYEPAQSAWLPVPPPQLDVNIAMMQSKQPEVKSVHAYTDVVTIEFDKFMLPSTMTLGNITVTQNGQLIEGEIVSSNIELDLNGNAYCSKVEYKPVKNLEDGEVVVFVSKAVKSYANINMAEDFTQSFTIELRISSININETVDVPTGSSLRISASILPASAANGKSVKIESLNTMIATVSKDDVKIDKDGNFDFDITGLIIGNTAVKLTIEDYDVETIVNVNVTTPCDENQVATPYASIESGEVESGTEIRLSCNTENASIYYTTDGSCPCDINRLRYDGSPIIVSQDMTLKIMAEAEGMVDSEIAEYHYTIDTHSGVENAQLNKDLSIYPLPLGEYLNISNGNKNIEAVSIFDMNGHRMVHSNKPVLTVSLRVGFLPTGIYLLSIETNGQTIMKKVVKR